MTVTIVLFVDPVKVGPAPVNPLPSPINDAAVTIPVKVAFPPDLMVAALPTLKFPDASMVILGSPFVPNVNALSLC